MFAGAETLLLCGLAHPLLTAFAGNVNHVTSVTHPADAQRLNDYYAAVHQVEIGFAFKYIVILAAGITLPMLIFFFGSLIRSEGKFRVVTIISVVSNIFNIGVSVLFIQFAHLGVMGGSLSCLVCYFGNLIFLLFYLIYLMKKNETWLSFKHLA
jgi:Na+-driven multidrug efflux pump